MARGWESKSIESQQEDASQKVAARPAYTPEQREIASRKAALEMALAQTHAEMGAACRPAHREMLGLRLAAIKAQIEEL